MYNHAAWASNSADFIHILPSMNYVRDRIRQPTTALCTVYSILLHFSVKTLYLGFLPKLFVLTHGR